MTACACLILYSHGALSVMQLACIAALQYCNGLAGAAVHTFTSGLISNLPDCAVVAVAPLQQQPLSVSRLPNVGVKPGKTHKGEPLIDITLSNPASDKGVFRLINGGSFITQDQAQSYCKAEGGNLASIHSQQALDILHNMIRQGAPWGAVITQVWIGLYNDGPGTAMKWYDGSKVDFTRPAYGFSPSEASVMSALSVAASYLGGAYFYNEVDGWQQTYLLCKLQ